MQQPQIGIFVVWIGTTEHLLAKEGLDVLAAAGSIESRWKRGHSASRCLEWGQVLGRIPAMGGGAPAPRRGQRSE